MAERVAYLTRFNQDFGLIEQSEDSPRPSQRQCWVAAEIRMRWSHNTVAT